MNQASLVDDVFKAKHLEVRLQWVSSLVSYGVMARPLQMLRRKTIDFVASPSL